MLRLAQQRLAATERTFGYDHPSVAAELQFIGAVHHESGNYNAALGFYGVALGILQRTLGAGHPAVKATAMDISAARREELQALAATSGGVDDPPRVAAQSQRLTRH
jgi:hypothetical protein